MSETHVIKDLSASLIQIRAELRELAIREKELKAEKEELEIRLMQAMDAVGTSMAQANGHSISISEVVVPSMSDYDEFTDWLRGELADHPEYLSLYERKISGPVYRELIEEREGEAIPGLNPFTRRSISLRNLG